MRIAPFCTLQIISEFLTYPEALEWLSAANGNAESRLLRQETVLSASAAVEYEYHLAYVGALEVEAQDNYDEVWDLMERNAGRSRREQLEWELRDEEEHQRREDEERIRRARFGNGLIFRTERDDDLNRCIWRRWAGEE